MSDESQNIVAPDDMTIVDYNQETTEASMAWEIIIIMAVLVAIAGGVFFFFNLQKKRKEAMKTPGSVEADY